MEHPLSSTEALVRPWRTATIVASAVAALELVVLVVAGAALLAKPIARHVRASAETHAFAPIAKSKAAKAKTRATTHHGKTHAATPKLSRPQTSVLVLNGNGRSGAAGSAAVRIQRRGYRVAATANAKRTDYAASVVMYRPGLRPEGLRLARDLGIRVVGPLDGMTQRDLQGAKLVLILGA